MTLRGSGPSHCALLMLVGAALVFPAAASAQFVQQGPKLSAPLANALQGWSVAISADGTTALVGAPWESADGRQPDPSAGAVHVWIRHRGLWSQQGRALRSEGGIGYAVSLSADGNTALIGYWEREGASIWTRSGEVWTEQAHLVGTGAIGAAQQGRAVALSADGSTAIVGGPSDNTSGALPGLDPGV